MERLVLLLLVFVAVTQAATTVNSTQVTDLPDTDVPVTGENMTTVPDVASTTVQATAITSGPGDQITDQVSTISPVTEVLGTTVVEEGNATDSPGNGSRCTMPAFDQIQKVEQFTNTEDFQDLSVNQQVFVYELLATAENCELTLFISPRTVQRLLLLAEDLPLKYVYTLFHFLSKSLAAEGVIVPV